MVGGGELALQLAIAAVTLFGTLEGPMARAGCHFAPWVLSVIADVLVVALTYV